MEKYAIKKKGNTPLKLILKILLFLIISVALIFIIIVGSWNGMKYAFYKDYYSISTELRKNPGLDDGYVTQGNCYYQPKDYYITSGYMSDKSLPSRIYNVRPNGDVGFCEIYNADGSKNSEHFGGISYYDGNFYVASNSKLHVINAENVINYSKATISYSVDVNNHASFTYSKDESIFVGEFNDSTNYKTSNEEKIDDNTTYHAIISEYIADSINEDNQPILKNVYHIRDKVQGFCITDSGKMVLSTSWGASPSIFYVYNTPTEVKRIENSVNHYYLDDSVLSRTIEGPAMAEDLDYYNGKVITSSEAASTKYLFGKLFLYDKIEGLTIA
mgnify:CR=1 FL=1